jgi:DNA-binding winged helix-turn-helix (wHTH) protein/tetratricopeptide (TPR) repeat protein
MSRIFRFGDWSFDRDSHVLARGVHTAHLEPKVARLLEYFLAHPGELLSHDRLVEDVWDGRVVSDEAVRRAISSLRHSLGSEDAQEIIKTVHGCGYIGHFPVLIGEVFREPGPEYTSTEPGQQDIDQARNSSLKSKILKLDTRFHIRAWLALALGAIAVELVAGYVADMVNPPPASVSLPVENSVAVLPFEVCQDWVGDRVLADGLTSAVHKRLAQHERLKVTGRRSTEIVVQSQAPMVVVSQLLGVRYLLNGVLCRDGPDLSVHAELTDNQGYTTWEQDFTQKVNPHDQVEGQLALLVENGVATEFGDVMPASRIRAVDRRALEQLLIGEEHSRQGDDDKARAALEKALQLQPAYAEALLELAWLEAGDKTFENEEDAMKKGLRLMEQALPLAESELQRDPGSFEATRVAGRIKSSLGYLEEDLAFREYREVGEQNVAARLARSQVFFAEAEQHYRVALAINPSATDVRRRLAQAMAQQGVGRRKESLDILRQGLDRDPFNEDLSINTAYRLVEFGRLREGMELLDRFDVLPQGKTAMLWWHQLEMLQNHGRWDEKLARLIDILDYDPGLFLEKNSPLMLHLWWVVPDVAWLGLYEEAGELYTRVAAIPRPAHEDQEQWEHLRGIFLEEFYLLATDRADEVVAQTIEQIAGMNNEDILKTWTVEMVRLIDALWLTGERERAIALNESMQYWSFPSTLWAERKLENARMLAKMYIAVGRDDDALPLLQNIVTQLQTEVDAGVRHPRTLLVLAEAYAWLGEDETALKMLDLAIDYGAINIASMDFGFCCEEFLLGNNPYEPNRRWWDKLAQEPRLMQSGARMRALIEQQRSNIRALLALHDMDRLLEPLMQSD